MSTNQSSIPQSQSSGHHSQPLVQQLQPGRQFSQRQSRGGGGRGGGGAGSTTQRYNNSNDRTQQVYTQKHNNSGNYNNHNNLPNSFQGRYQPSHAGQTSVRTFTSSMAGHGQLYPVGQLPPGVTMSNLPQNQFSIANSPTFDENGQSGLLQSSNFDNQLMPVRGQNPWQAIPPASAAAGLSAQVEQQAPIEMAGMAGDNSMAYTSQLQQLQQQQQQQFQPIPPAAFYPYNNFIPGQGVPPGALYFPNQFNPTQQPYFGNPSSNYMGFGPAQVPIMTTAGGGYGGGLFYPNGQISPQNLGQFICCKCQQAQVEVVECGTMTEAVDPTAEQQQ